MRNDDVVVSRASSAFLIAGGVAALVGGATHGDLPEDSGAAALRFLTDHPAYALVHFVSILGGVLWALGLAGADGVRSSSLARWLMRSSGRTGLVGAGVLAVQFSLDGVGSEALAALWSEPGADRAMLETVAEMAPEVLIGVALTWVMLLYGLAPLLAGCALVADGDELLGWSGVVLGAFGTCGALVVALGSTVVPDWLVFAAAIIGGSLWAIALGVHDLVRIARHRAAGRLATFPERRGSDPT
jgi:hypothetical protein